MKTYINGSEAPNVMLCDLISKYSEFGAGWAGRDSKENEAYSSRVISSAARQFIISLCWDDDVAFEYLEGGNLWRHDSTGDNVVRKAAF